MFRLTGRFLVVLMIAGWAGAASAYSITDTVTVEGKEWAQVDLSTNLSWEDINAVCPSGICAEGGVLNGYTMTGWVWASVDDVNALINVYMSAAGLSGNDLLGPGPDYKPLFGNDIWAPAFMADFRPTLAEEGVGEQVSGFTRTPWAHSLVYRADVVNIFYPASDVLGEDFASTNHNNNDESSKYTSVGAWFYAATDPTSSVPVPATLPLLSAALAGLYYSRRKHNLFN